jgi:hypothetical protein
MLCGENALPYDRIKLSKMLDATAEKLKLRSDAFYKVILKTIFTHEVIELLLTAATGIKYI